MCVFCVCVSVCIDQISIRCFPPLLHLKNYMIYFFLSLFIPPPHVCVCGRHMCCMEVRGHTVEVGSLFPPWVLGVELRESVLVARAITCWAVLPAFHLAL